MQFILKSLKLSAALWSCVPFSFTSNKAIVLFEWKTRPLMFYNEAAPHIWLLTAVKLQHDINKAKKWTSKKLPRVEKRLPRTKKLTTELFF